MILDYQKSNLLNPSFDSEDDYVWICWKQCSRPDRLSETLQYANIQCLYDVDIYKFHNIDVVYINN